MARNAADDVYRQTGLGPADVQACRHWRTLWPFPWQPWRAFSQPWRAFSPVGMLQVIELHDCFSANELLT